jgi:26S proteasome regulatory subunit, ATPase 3, interacting protein
MEKTVDGSTECLQEVCLLSISDSSLLGLLVENGQIAQTKDFEEDQGINPDDEEAKDIENGEFCKPGNTNKAKIIKKVEPAVPTKREASHEGEVKTKKAKKVKGE